MGDWITENPAKTLVVHNFYQIGGGEHTVFENECRLLRENGHEVVTYTRSNDELKESVVKKAFLPISTVYSLKTYREVRRIIRNEGIQIVHCHNTFPLISPSVYYAARRCGVPVIQTIHNFRLICANGVLSRKGKPCEECLQKGLKCALDYRCYRKSRLQTLVLVNMLRIHRALGTYRKIHYIFLTPFNREKFRSLLGNRLDSQNIKPNFEYIDTEKFPADETRENAYVYIGRLEKDKGIDFVLKAWKEEIRRDLYIFGSGELQEDVEAACGLNKRVHWMGFQPREVLFDSLRKSKGLLFSTDLYEGFPMTIIEAFAMGTPVVCSDIGNGADIVRKHKAGVPYKVRDIQSFRDALAAIEEDFEQYSKKALNAYWNYYTPEKNYQELKKIYQGILKRQ